MISNIPFLLAISVLLVSTACSGNNACVIATVPDDLYIVKEPRRIYASFEDESVLQRPENGYAYAIVVEIDGRYYLPLYCVKRGSAGGGPVVDDLWPVISSIGMNSQSMYIPNDGWDKIILLLNPISELGEDVWYYLEYKDDKLDSIVIPDSLEGKDINNNPNGHVFLDLIKKAESFRSKARS